jgi:hypothetical protein
MLTTTNRRSPLARRHHIEPRWIAEPSAWRERRDQFAALFADAHPKPPEIIAITRAEPRTKLYDERQREIIHAGIRAGMISRERLIRYRAQQLLDDLAQFHDQASAGDVMYVRAMLETAEMVEAQTVARALPTETNRMTALRETREAIAVAELMCVILDQGGAR